MGGSGGTGISTDYITGGPGPIDASCRSLAFEANVASANPAVVAGIRPGDVLKVAIVGYPPQIALLTPSGDTVGALTDHWGDLTQCTEQGFEYQATVVRTSPAVRVHVQLKR